MGKRLPLVRSGCAAYLFLLLRQTPSDTVLHLLASLRGLCVRRCVNRTKKVIPVTSIFGLLNVRPGGDQVFSTLAYSHGFYVGPPPRARLKHFAPVPSWGLDHLREVDGSRRKITPHCHGPSPLYRRWAANHYDYGEETIAGSKRLCSLPLSAPPSNPKRNLIAPSSDPETRLCFLRGIATRRFTSQYGIIAVTGKLRPK